MRGVRIVGGVWRGKTIETPDGRGTRPTTERTRERIASMVYSSFDLDLTGVRVLDGFAGSGALGFEMLSRGARHCTFVDSNRKVCALIKRNCKNLGVGDSGCVVCGDILKLAHAGHLSGGPFDLIVLDPPYALDATAVDMLVTDLRQQNCLAPEARILYEHAAGTAGLKVAFVHELKSKEHGATRIDLLVARELHSHTKEI